MSQFKITSFVAGAATLVLAALPMAALSSAAHAAPASMYKVQIADLNLASPADQQVLDQRIAKTAKNFCRNTAPVGTLTRDRVACAAAVRAEVTEKASAASDVMLASR